MIGAQLFRLTGVLLAIAAVFRPLPAAASDLQTWHAFETSFGLASGWEINLHGRFQTQDYLRGFLSTRAGILLDGDLNSRFAASLAYFSEYVDNNGGWEPRQRIRAGGNVLLYENNSGLKIEVRSLVERFLQPGADEIRYRNLLQAGVGRWSFGIEGFVTDGVFFSEQRYSVERRFDVGGVVLRLGYLYNARKQQFGGDRHVIQTTVNFGRVCRRSTNY
jgi:hypothetical protein